MWIENIPERSPFMGRKKLISLLVGSALVLVAVFGAVTYRSVFAQSATATPSTSNAPATTTTTNQAKPVADVDKHGGYTEQELATALGIDITELQSAEQSATSEALKQAVSAGLITQAQADQIAQDSQNGKAFDGHLPFLSGTTSSTIDYNALLAQALGITTTQLQAAKQTAYLANIDAAVTSGSMTQAQADLAKGSYILQNNSGFQSAMKTAFDNAVKQAVTDGLITQAQADQVLAQNANGFTGLQDFRIEGFGGQGRGHGGPGRTNGGNTGSTTNQPSAVPTTTP
jgi:hypothetical protein